MRPDIAGTAPGRPLRISRFARLLGAALLPALALHALMTEGGLGVSRLLVLAALALLLLAGLARAHAGQPALLACAALLSALYAAAVPLLTTGLGTLPTRVAASPVWPQLLVLLPAARLQSILVTERLRSAWIDPVNAEGPMRSQSLGGALSLGLAGTLLLYAALETLAAPVMAAGAPDALGVTLRAVLGATYVHVAIMILFLTLLAACLDALLRQCEDRAVLTLVRARLRESLPVVRADFAEALRDLPGDSRSGADMREAAGLPGAETARRSLDAVHASTRRYLRALLAFLPLLGFVGTVIGLAVAIGSLGGDGGSERPGGVADIGASLAGLSIQFETTLLGLLGGLVASLVLAAIERREGETRAQCHRLVEVALRTADAL
ncbi:MotA/TolQ/ExbB proton channel family protein [uncultured Aureimonas sp.]|uniref:MotA/TolQ/ExbB proton channel family protein n=1 Tax=uncultured Aureimonas sp. TaxID=1604662 RepID=UPI0025EF9D58|nr:MotA/TolQ/ExbB proton channel family protein [uncultured Aureimonas sp.]